MYYYLILCTSREQLTNMTLNASSEHQFNNFQQLLKS